MLVGWTGFKIIDIDPFTFNTIFRILINVLIIRRETLELIAPLQNPALFFIIVFLLSPDLT